MKIYQPNSSIHELSFYTSLTNFILTLNHCTLLFINFLLFKTVVVKKKYYPLYKYIQ